MIVWSMARVGSHSVRDWLRLHGFPGAFVLHAVCLDNGHLLPARGEHRYDPEKDPELVGGEALVIAQRIRQGEGVECVVPVRNPVDRAVSAWRYFHKSRGRIDDYDHQAGDEWWTRQYERFGERHSTRVVRIEDGAKALAKAVGVREFGTLGRAVATEGGKPPEFTEALKDALRGSIVAREFYSEAEVEEAFERWK